jgi:ABC-type transport system involved in multi-copper enzyme maturation permease subunit
MKNIITILRRDLGTCFTSPIGYIFMIVYVIMSVGLYITSFFTYPVADLRPYFTNLPILLCVFIPAVTMRVWAEERKENTWEMLLTFPMRSRELVLGKFFACFIFFALTLACTFTLPVMLFSLGKPDVGAMFGGYFGTLLLGGFFLSIGIFFSGFFKDQIVAFVVTLLACFGIFLVGTDFISSYIDGMLPGWGTLLSQLVGVVDHYNAFSRGVIELADLFYFAAWTILFLMLNIMFIEGRSRPKARVTFATALIMCCAIGLLFNWLLTGTSLARFDITEDKVFTVCDASKSILGKVDSPVQVKVYITPREEMPTGLTQLEQNVKDKLEELRLAAGGKLNYTTVYLNVANVLNEEKAEEQKKEKEGEETEEKAIEKRMLDKGVEPFSVRAMSEDEVTNKLIYSSIGVGYKDKKEEIIPQIMPQNLDELEYRLVSTVYKLTREKQPVIALVAPKEAVNIDPQYRKMLEQMGQPVPQSDDPYVYLEQILHSEKYDVHRVDLTEDSPLPEEYDTLVVVNPREFNERQRWEIARALQSGKSVVMAVQNYEWDYKPSRTGTSISKREEKPQVNELLKEFGLGVSDEILMDVNHVPLTVQSSANSLQALLGGGQTVNLPTHILVNGSSMAQDNSITSRLSSIFYLWGSPLTLDQDVLKKYNLEAKTLMSTTSRAWTVPATQQLTNSSFEAPSSAGKQYPLMEMVSGQFPDVNKDKPRPAWPKEPQAQGQPPKPEKPEEGEAKPVTPAPGKLILFGCSEIFRKNFLQAGNLDLFLNSVDAVSLGDEMVNVRSRKPVDRMIEMPSTTTRNVWKFVNYTLAAAIIAVLGVTQAALRRRARNAYTMSFGTTEE